MRRTVLILTSLSLVVVPVAAAADKPEKADKLAKPETAVTVPTSGAAAAGGQGAKGKADTGSKGETGKGRSEPAKELAPVHAPQAPVLGQSVAVGPRAGTVRVRSADGKTFALTAGASIPAGSVIDATNGTVAMTSALDANGHVQTAEFRGGRFLIRQSATGDGMVDIYLKGSIGRCRTKANTAGIASTSSTKLPARRPWARHRNGKFR